MFCLSTCRSYIHKLAIYRLASCLTIAVQRIRFIAGEHNLLLEKLLHVIINLNFAARLNLSKFTY